MATVDARQPRRKVATYGKSCRKRIFNLDRGISAAPSHQTQAWHMSANGTEAGIESRDSEKMLPSKSLKSDNLQLRSETSDNSVPSRGALGMHEPPKSSIFRYGKRSLQTKPRKHEGLEPDRLKEGRDVFDLPSSDEDRMAPTPISKHRILPRSHAAELHDHSQEILSDSGTSVSSGDSGRNLTTNTRGATPTKKLKMASVLSDSYRPVVYDDDALQRHVAMECVIEDTLSGDYKPSVEQTIHVGTRGEQQDLAAKTREPSFPQVQVYQPRKTNPPSSKLPNPSPQKAKGPDESTRRGPASNRVTAVPAKSLSKKVEPPSLLPTSKPARSADAIHQSSAQQGILEHIKTSQNSPKRRRNDEKPSAQPKDKRSRDHTTPTRRTAPTNDVLGNSAVEFTPSSLNLGSLKLSPQEAMVKATSFHKASSDESDRPCPSLSKTSRNRKYGKRLIDSLVDGSPGRSHDSISSALCAHGATTPDRKPSPLPDEGLEDRDLIHSSAQEDVPEYISESQPSSQGPAVAQQGGPKITYARQRSYLSESALDETALLNTPIDLGMGQGSQGSSVGGRRNLRATNLGAVDEGEESVDGVLNGAMKSVHELRQAGGNKRFLDESEAVFEDIEDRGSSSISRRRNGLINIGMKLIDKDYTRQFVDRDLDRRLFNGLDTEQDTIICFMLASVIALLAHHGIGNVSLSHMRQEGAVTLLTRLLDFDRSIVSVAKNRQSNMSKVAQSMLGDFESSLRQVLLPPTSEPIKISPRTMSLICLRAMTRRSREAGDVGEVLSDATVHALVGLLDSTSAWSAPDVVVAEAVSEVELILSILEAYTLNAGSLASATVRNRLCSPTITNLLPLVSGSRSDAFKQIQLLTLRVLLNLTNKRPSFCRAIGTTNVVRSLVRIIQSGFETVSETLDDEERMSSVDYLILALATLTNLTEWTEESQPSLWLEKFEDSTLLDVMLEPFLRGLEKSSEANSMEETQFNVAFGYLAVLFSVLSLRSEIRQHVCSRLPGATIQPLLAAVEEFLHYHQRVDDQLRKEGQSTDSQDGFKERLQANLDLLKRSC
ncbi:MAG: hypothetical protein M1837_000302 [Sclerophora amabilis]|nr:MAG: hypothetical protein M1837_000302 [Sclerophora amabilis]